MYLKIQYIFFLFLNIFNLIFWVTLIDKTYEKESEVEHLVIAGRKVMLCYFNVHAGRNVLLLKFL